MTVRTGISADGSARVGPAADVESSHPGSGSSRRENLRSMVGEAADLNFSLAGVCTP
jgi:hypothetical protein